MSSTFTRSNLGRGPAHVTYNGATLFTRDSIVSRHAPAWDGVRTSLYGEVDQFKRDLVIKVALPLWGAWENLGTLFPAAALNPTIGASVFGAADAPLTLFGRNGDQIQYTNAQITKLADLHLGVNGDLFAAAVEFTCLCANAANPEELGAYYTVQSGVAYADSAFAKTNFLKVRWSGSWGAKPGFTSFAGQNGFRIGWKFELKPVVVDGYGTRDMTVAGFKGTCKCIPIGPTLAQLEAAAQAQGVALGGLLSNGAADLAITGSGHSVVLKNAAITEHGYAFGVEPLRLGEMAWETTRGFAAGLPAAAASVS
jgi:hypothetical protein